MPTTRISERVKNFIFMYVDSVELLEVLLLFHTNTAKSWNAQTVAVELRSNSNSTSQRILFLKSLDLVRETAENSSEYIYHSQNSEMNETINDLAAEYRLHRRLIFELIFSPMKRARDLADAFRKNAYPNKPEDK